MRFARVVEASSAVAATRARSAKIQILATLIAELTPDEVPLAVHYLSGELPQGKIGLGYAAAFGVKAEPVPESTLELRELDRRLGELGAQKGAGANGRRLELFGALLALSSEAEQAFLKRLVVGELRQGALEGVMAEAIAAAYRAPAALVRRAAMLTGDLARVATALAEGGPETLATFRLQLFRPLAPMLAQSAAGPGEALEALGSAILEPKLDGARLQLHKQGEEVRLYTRSLHDVTARAPEIVALARALPASSLILDGEVLSLRAGGRPQPFQVTMRRFGSKKDDAALRAELPLTPFFFDVLHANGDDLLDRPALERSEALKELVPETARVPSVVSAEPEEADAFFARALALGHEGVMAKAKDAPYEAGRRGAAWLKLKPAHTLDLVVLAVEWGSGRRAGFLSNIHLGARDPRDESFVMLGKTFKGMTDAMLAWQTAEFQKLALGQEGHVVHLKPETVVEIAFDGLQASQQYPGGLALRFARVKRYRPDKSARDADTIDTVRAIAAGEGAAPTL
ncbi:MAG TPA: ATP-dependent DNA ligase [Polyangiaceae bacterium]|nr:ATP-dependent DNA ligase [Polyangiaceae bacterium]